MPERLTDHAVRSSESRRDFRPGRSPGTNSTIARALSRTRTETYFALTLTSIWRCFGGTGRWLRGGLALPKLIRGRDKRLESPPQTAFASSAVVARITFTF